MCILFSIPTPHPPRSAKEKEEAMPYSSADIRQNDIKVVGMLYSSR